MNEILFALRPGAKVLDLGSGSGSFDAAGLQALVVRADISVPIAPPTAFVQCSAAALPFPCASFDAVILNHSLEHFDNPRLCLTEIGRVINPDGFLYIAIPDASTLTDRLYRWLARGGGHVNLFTDPAAVAQLVTQATGLAHVGTRILFSSLSFLNQANRTTRAPGKLILLGNGNEHLLRILNWILRRADQYFGFRSAVYGWAFYFGRVPPELNLRSWINVCVRCGSAHDSKTLATTGRVRNRRILPSLYTCPRCGTLNYFIKDAGSN